MYVGICMHHSKDDMRKRFEDAVRLGFRHAQLISWDPGCWTDESAREIRALCKEFDFTITAFWCGWEGPKFWNFIEGPETLGLVPEAYRYGRMRNLQDGAAFAKKLDVTDVITHMGFIPMVPADPKYPGFLACVKSLGETLKASGQNLLFETGQETPVTLLRTIEDAGTGNLFINLDTANLILYGMGHPIDAVSVFGKYIRNTHAKDGFYPTNGRELGREVKVGEGRARFPALIRALREVGYDGCLTIEREISGEQQIKDIIETKKYLEELISC